jgi:hypothetical protein
VLRHSLISFLADPGITSDIDAFYVGYSAGNLIASYLLNTTGGMCFPFLFHLFICIALPGNSIRSRKKQLLLTIEHTVEQLWFNVAEVIKPTKALTIEHTCSSGSLTYCGYSHWA